MVFSMLEIPTSSNNNVVAHTTRKLARPSVWRAAAVAFPFIVVVVSLLFGASYFLTTFLGLPFSLSLSLELRVVGGMVVVVGLSVMGWVFSHRSPANMMVSTYVTFTKMFRRAPFAEMAGRTEPLIIDGPQRYARNPLYFGVVMMVFGWALVSANTFVFVATLALFLWFRVFLIPFEERELQALFGDQWKRYSEETPMLIPFTKGRARRRGP